MNEFISVALRADSTNLQKGFAAATASVRTFQKAAGALHATGSRIDAMVASIGRGSAKMSAGLAAAMVASGHAAMNFETRMRNVNSIAMESEARFREMGEEVLDMSRNFPIAATTMADGLYDLASSGFAGAEAVSVLKEANIAATAGMTDTATAVQGIASVINAYQLSADQAKDVSDILFKTVDLGIISFEELVHQLGDFVPLGQAVGIQFDEMASAISALTLAGFPAAQAATSLAGVMRSFIKPSEGMTAAVREQGYESATAMLSTLGLQGAIEALTNGVDDNVEAIATMFQHTEGLRGVLALTANEGAQFSESLAAIADETQRAGAAQAAYEEQAKSTSVSLQLFWNSLTAARIEIGQYYLPVLAAVLDHGASLLNLFGELPGPVKAGVAAFIALGQATTMLVGLLALGRVRALVFAKALTDSRLATRLGINEARSFTQVLMGLSSALARSSTAVAVAAKAQRALAVPLNLTRVAAGHASAAMLRGDAALSRMAASGGRTSVAMNGVAATLRRVGVALDGFASRTTRLGGTLTRLSTRMRAASAAGRGLGAVMGRLRASAGLMGTGLLAGITILSDWNSTAKEARSEAEALREEVSQNYDMSTAKGMADAYDEMYQNLVKANEESEKNRGFWGNVKGGLQVVNPFDDNTIQKSHEAVIAQAGELEELTQRYNRHNEVLKVFGITTGLGAEEGERLAQVLGLDLSNGLSASERAFYGLYKMGLLSEEALRRNILQSDGVAGSMSNAARSVEDGTWHLSGLGEQLRAIRSPMSVLIDDTLELTDAQKDLHAALQDVGSASDAWTEALNAKREERQRIVDEEIERLEKESEARIRAAEEAAEARQEGIDSEIRALREAGSKENDTSYAVDAAENRKRAARKSSQDQLEALRERERELLEQQVADLQATVDEQILSLDEYAQALEAQNLKLEAWRDNTVTVAGRVGEEVAQFIASMGEDGVELMSLMATGSQEEVERMREAIIKNMDLTGEESAVELSAGMAMAEQAAKLGGAATRDAVLEELGLLPEDARDIMDRFGRAIEDGLNSVLEGLGRDPIDFGWEVTVPPGYPGGVMGAQRVAPPVVRPIKRVMALGGIAKEGDGIMFNEPGVGGEAYIPLGMQNRDRSRRIWEETGRLLGIRSMSRGGILGSGGTAIINNDSSTRIERREETRFTGPIYLSDPQATIAYANRKKRLAKLRGGADD